MAALPPKGHYWLGLESFCFKIPRRVRWAEAGVDDALSKNCAIPRRAVALWFLET